MARLRSATGGLGLSIVTHNDHHPLAFQGSPWKKVVSDPSSLPKDTVFVVPPSEHTSSQLPIVVSQQRDGVEVALEYSEVNFSTSLVYNRFRKCIKWRDICGWSLQKEQNCCVPDSSRLLSSVIYHSGKKAPGRILYLTLILAPRCKVCVS